MFDINDIAKTAFEPVLFTPLQRAQKDGYINITGVDGKKKIEYMDLCQYFGHKKLKVSLPKRCREMVVS